MTTTTMPDTLEAYQPPRVRRRSGVQPATLDRYQRQAQTARATWWPWVLREAARATGIAREDVTQPHPRDRAAHRARRIAMGVARDLGAPVTVIGLLVRLDHSTVSYGLQRLAENPADTQHAHDLATFLQERAA